MRNNRVNPTDQNLKKGTSGEHKDSYTSEDFLGQLDTYFFVASLLNVTLITAILFSMILVRHLGSPGEKFDVDPAPTTRTTHATTLAQVM